MKKIIFSLSFVSILFASCNHETKDERFCRQAREFTKSSCPKPMDKYTVLDSLVYSVDRKTMKYHYSVSGIMDAPAVYSEEMLKLFHTNLLDNICQNLGLLELKEHGVIFCYTYVSSIDTTEYMTFTFTPEDYR